MGAADAIRTTTRLNLKQFTAIHHDPSSFCSKQPGKLNKGMMRIYYNSFLFKFSEPMCGIFKLLSTTDLILSLGLGELPPFGFLNQLQDGP